MRLSPKIARQYIGMTQVEMARELGVSRDVYRRIEKKPETATIEQGKKIAEVSGMDFAAIFLDDYLQKVE